MASSRQVHYSSEVTIAGGNVKPKLKMEPTRTTKTSQKLVVFPEAEVAQTLFPDSILDEPGSVQKTSLKQLRRVTAYLTAEAHKLRELGDFLQSKKSKNALMLRRYDEVLYTPYRFFKKTATAGGGGSLCDLDEPDVLEGLEGAVASTFPVGEVFFFEYGVVVIWGLEESDEREILSVVRPFEVSPLDAEDVETEDFKFCHDPDRPPRIFNDIINLRSGHHKVKLTISHALAQSVKLSYFEELVESTIITTQKIPYELASSGIIKMSRKTITKQIGELFVMRMNVNLISNVLDTPEIFWSEPSLCPLYRTVRGYLEISQRIEVLNQRCTVISDMLTMLREHSNNLHGETLEWIVIILIALEIFIGLFHILIEVCYTTKHY